MSLAVIAPQSLQSLEKMVTSSFQNIRNNSNRPFLRPEEKWNQLIAPFTGEYADSIIPSQGYIVEVVPVADSRQVNLVWPVVYHSLQDRLDQYLIKPAVFVSHLLGHEGQNSLLSYLKRQGWANALGASTDADFSDFYSFGVTVELTSQGLNHVEKVIEAIFSYIAMMNNGKDIPRYILEEVLRISELNWRFLTKVW
jgi:insulysin